jgi:hypothetical protein
VDRRRVRIRRLAVRLSADGHIEKVDTDPRIVGRFARRLVDLAPRVSRWHRVDSRRAASDGRESTADENVLVPGPPLVESSCFMSCRAKLRLDGTPTPRAKGEKAPGNTSTPAAHGWRNDADANLQWSFRTTERSRTLRTGSC